MTATRAAVEADTGLAAAIESAGFVRVLARADGDAVAASGLLARALADRAIPYQVSVAPTVADRTARLESDGDDVTVVVGDGPESSHRLAPEGSATPRACELVADLGSEPEPILALAGAAAAGIDPESGELARLRESTVDDGLIEPRPGIATPTDATDALAHTTLCRGPWSGDSDAAESLVEAAGGEPTATASAVAIDAVGGEASRRAAHAVERVLRPARIAGDHPFATVEGYADVLRALARTTPGLGVALAAGNPGRVREAALETWREHGRRAHAALDRGATRRYDGLVVVETDDAVEAVAGIAADYRSPEPTVLAIDGENGEAALATTEARPLGEPLAAAAKELGAGNAYDVGPRRGYLRIEGDRDAVVTAVRGAL
ncbi:exonuclease [Saliphagus infecundisoli]|uniref:Exonuclease n=1 Tax=Saliphagus infecundisoli TaxID=1849069 RepID=A0ABD5Q9Q8_9EURY|nr:exonuclease [Saliphagus infecundisoli]